MKPQVCLYPCSACKKIIKWHEEPMYLVHNSKSLFVNYNFMFFCTSCYIDDLLFSFVLDDDSEVNSTKYYYIHDSLKAVITQDNNYLSQNCWQVNPIINTEFINDNDNSPEPMINSVNKMYDYNYFFYFFIINYDPMNSFINIILKTAVQNYGIPIYYGDIYIDNLILNSNMSDIDKIFYQKEIFYKLYNNYYLSKLITILPEDIVLQILEF